MRKTKQRRVILDVLAEHKDHPGAETIYKEVKGILPGISLGTVYRNLELLVETGQIMKLDSGKRQKRFDPNPDPHPHFRCLKCGSLEDLPFSVDSIVEMKGDEEWAKGRQIKNIVLEYTGLCAMCSGSGTVL